MPKISLLVSRALGGFAPAHWGSVPSRLGLVGALALFAVGCSGEEEKRTLDPIQLGMTKGMAPVVEGEGDDPSLYEVKRAVRFPIQAPTAAEQAALNGAAVTPFLAKPWMVSSDIKVQVSWTLTNLDPETHNVELLLDPWNEFGRYWPGLSVTDAQREEQMPNLSGIDILMELPGTASGRDSRRHGVFTEEDMKEMSIDLATAMNIILTAPPPDPSMDAEENPAVGLVNHAFAVENRSYNDVIIQHGCGGATCIPTVIPGLTGFDLGLRTFEEANVAIEILVELVDTGNGKVVPRDETPKAPGLLLEPTAYITIGNGSY